MVERCAVYTALKASLVVQVEQSLSFGCVCSSLRLDVMQIYTVHHVQEKNYCIYL